jgi:hypothetical protein
VSRKLTPIPGYTRTHIDFGQFCWLLDVAPRTGHRLLEQGEVGSFLIGGKRRIDLASAEQYLERCRAKGPQFSPRPVTGKRPVGRPRKQPAEAAS